MAANVDSQWGLLAAWAIGGAVALAGGLCYAELATAYPRDGGDYVFLTKAFGSRAGFLFAWAEYWIIRPGNVGMMAFVFALRATVISAVRVKSSSRLPDLLVRSDWGPDRPQPIGRSYRNNNAKRADNGQSPGVVGDRRRGNDAFAAPPGTDDRNCEFGHSQLQYALILLIGVVCGWVRPPAQFCDTRDLVLRHTRWPIAVRSAMERTAHGAPASRHSLSAHADSLLPIQWLSAAGERDACLHAPHSGSLVDDQHSGCWHCCQPALPARPGKTGRLCGS